MGRLKIKPDSYQALRRKMRRETEIALTYGLSFPDRVPAIPTIEVGTGSFDPVFAEQYWAERLELNRKPGRRRRWWSLI
jgi:hypothetical protein